MIILRALTHFGSFCTRIQKLEMRRQPITVEEIRGTVKTFVSPGLDSISKITDGRNFPVVTDIYQNLRLLIEPSAVNSSLVY